MNHAALPDGTTGRELLREYVAQGFDWPTSYRMALGLSSQAPVRVASGKAGPAFMGTASIADSGTTGVSPSPAVPFFKLCRGSGEQPFMTALGPVCSVCLLPMDIEHVGGGAVTAAHGGV